jgi:multidrug efflux pump subunit AcrB
MREGTQNAITIAEPSRSTSWRPISASRRRASWSSWNDRSKIVKGRISLLLQNARSSLILVFICVGLFLRLDAVFWVAVGMVMAFLGAFALMPLFDLSINLSSVFGFILVLGIVVDDAIVTSEQVDTMRQQGLSPLDAAIEGTRRLAAPITFGVLTTIVAFLPMALGFGDFGVMFQPISIVFICVMLLALMETKLILPSHLAHRFHQPRRRRCSIPSIASRSGSSPLCGQGLPPLAALLPEKSLHRARAVFGGLGVLFAIFFSDRIATDLLPSCGQRAHRVPPHHARWHAL